MQISHDFLLPVLNYTLKLLQHGPLEIFPISFSQMKWDLEDLSSESSLDSFLNLGIALVPLKSLGMTELLSGLSKTFAEGFLISFVTSFRILGHNSSEPSALSNVTVLIALLSSPAQ